jgi:hypothetical protein
LRLAAASVIAGYRSAGVEGSLENRRFSGDAITQLEGAMGSEENIFG